MLHRCFTDLPDTWATCVGQHSGASFLEKFSDLVSFDRRSDLFRSWCAEEGDLHLQTNALRLLSQVRDAGL
jgi:hypothetical protein